MFLLKGENLKAPLRIPRLSICKGAFYIYKIMEGKLARARLHLICGNCGCNDMWEWRHQEKVVDEGEVISDEDVSISCGNCITLHSLNDNAKNRDKH